MDLTSQQRRVVEAEGDFILLACPGSGKTRSAAARVVELILAGRKVAVCSYTNVGADRFRSVIGAMGAVLGPEHYVGTLHAFLLRYVVSPFGPLAGAARGLSPARAGQWRSAATTRSAWTSTRSGSGQTGRWCSPGAHSSSAR